MIKFVIEKFRTSPGPLKEPRVILADIAEEVLNAALEYMGKVPSGVVEHGVASPSVGTAAPIPDPRPDDGRASEEPSPAKTADVGAGDDSKPLPRELEIDPRLDRAMSGRANMHKQDFKVLAILWDAYQRGLVPLSAKAVSQHGERIGLAIRHENVRKVVRMRLEKYVDFHNEGAGSGTIYRYLLNAAGRDHFAATYLRDNEG